MNALALAIAMPDMYQGVRLPTQDGPRTGVVTVKDQYTVTNSSATPPNWNSGDLLFALYGQVGRYLVMYSTIVTGTYNLYFAGFGEGSSPSGSWVISPTNNFPVGNYNLSATWTLVGASGTGPHGSQLAIGMRGYSPYIFMNNNDTLSLGASWGTWTGTFNLEYYMYSGPNAADSPPVMLTYTVTAGAITGSSFTNTAPAGYCRVVIATLAVTSGTTQLNTGFSMNLNCVQTSGWRHLALTDFDSQSNGDVNMIQDCRVNAATLLCTNTTSLNSRQGTVLAARIVGKDPMVLVPADVAQSSKYTGDAAMGVYTFKEFSSYAEAFRQCVTGERTNFMSFDIDYNDFYHFIQVTCPGAGTTPNTYTLSLCATVEFKTQVQRYATGVAESPFGLLPAARTEINAVPDWFYENPLHMSDIYGWVLKKARAFAGHVRDNLPAYASIVRGVGSLLL